MKLLETDTVTIHDDGVVMSGNTHIGTLTYESGVIQLDSTHEEIPSCIITNSQDWIQKRKDMNLRLV